MQHSAMSTWLSLTDHVLSPAGRGRTWHISTVQTGQLDSLKCWPLHHMTLLLADVGLRSFPMTDDSAQYSITCLLLVLAAMKPEGLRTPGAMVTVTVSGWSQCWLRTVRRDRGMVVTQHSPVPVPRKRGGALQSAGRLSSLHSRILHVATQPCDSHWICAKSVFENAECQKRKSRGRQHDRNRPVETETEQVFLLHQTFCQRSKNMVGERGRRGLHTMSCVLLA